MEDYYEKYIDKKQIINQACDCIEKNSSSKLNDEISEIKNAISKLSIDDNWQDKAGSAFKKMISNCIKNLEKIETSISTDFSNSEKIYKLLKLRLEQLKKANELYNSNYTKEPRQSSYTKTLEKTIDDEVKKVSVNDVNAYNNAHKSWKTTIDTLQKSCINLSEEIDGYFKQLNEINEKDITMAYTLYKFDNSVKRFANAVGNGGNFISNNSDNTKHGSFVSNIDGRAYTIYDQTKIDGWSGFCNRAAAASIASGFALNGQNPITVANDVSKINSNIGYDQGATSDYFSKFGLSAMVDKVDCSYDLVKDKILSALKNGNKVMFDLSEEGVKGKSGQQWTSDRHWLTVLDYKKIGPGENDYAIFISDSSGRGGSTTDRGLGAGWYKLDEFSGQKVANVTTVQQANNTSTASTQATPSIKSSDTSSIKYTTDIPTDVKQAGYTVTCYESDGFHPSGSKQGKRWNPTTRQSTIQKSWVADGAKYENGLAIINDNGTKRYLVATSEKIGKPGDRLTVHFGSGESIDVLVADQKNRSDSNYSDYGHNYGGKTSVLEFEVNTQDYRERGNPGTEKWPLAWDNSSGVVSVDNHGSALDDLAVKV